MSGQRDDSRRDVEAARRAGAAEERDQILQLIESYARQLAHGHGATGGQILQRLAEAIQERGTTG